MSLTSHIRTKSAVYWHIISLLNLDYCFQLIRHHQPGKLIHRPVPGTEFSLVGKSVIYALRDFLGGKYIWEDTLAGQYYPYPRKSPEPVKWLVMGLMDSQARHNEYTGYPGHITALHPDLYPAVEDVAQIVDSFANVVDVYRQSHLIANPTFSASDQVGGADANLIIDKTLWDIRTTGRKYPLNLDCIIQQVGYYLLDFENKYELDSICWYYTRQQCLFEHPIEPLLTKGAKLRFQRMLEAA